MHTIRLPRLIVKSGYLRYTSLGYLWSMESGNRQHALLQFVDDAIIIANIKKHAQTYSMYSAHLG